MQQRSIPNVFCVGIDLSDLAPELREAITPFDWRSCGDVYRALVRIHREVPDLVIVGVDWLPSVAFEIFDILARTHRDLPVLVVGAKRAQGKLDDAIVRGAMGVATPAIIADLLAGDEPASPDHPDTNTLLTSERKKTDTFASPGNVFDAELDRRLREQTDDLANKAELGPSEPPVIEERQQITTDFASDTGVATSDNADWEDSDPGDSFTDANTTQANATDADPELEPDNRGTASEQVSESTVRVPWETYGSRPTRVPPTRSAPPAKDASPEPDRAEPRTIDTRPSDSRSSGAMVDDDPPLLTAEEIAALMGGEPFHRSN